MVYVTEFGAFGMYSDDGRYVEGVDDNDEDAEDEEHPPVTLLSVPAFWLSSLLPLKSSVSLSLS